MNNIVIEKINSLLKDKDKIIIAIDGPCASGKTTLSCELSEIFDCNVIHMDDFFLPFEKRTVERMNEVGGNIDYERFKCEVADNITKNEDFTYSKFDCSTGKAEKKITVTSKKVNIIEGVYSLHPRFISIYDIKIYLNIDAQTQTSRLKERSPEKLERFVGEWIPKENAYFEKFKIKDMCDIIL